MQLKYSDQKTTNTIDHRFIYSHYAKNQSYSSPSLFLSFGSADTYLNRAARALWLARFTATRGKTRLDSAARPKKAPTHQRPQRDS